MERTLRDLWWVPVFRGVSAVAFGILLLVWPTATISIVAFIFAAMLAVNGITDIVVGVQSMTRSVAGLLRVLLGFLEMGIVIFLFRNAGSGMTLQLMGLLMAVALIVEAILLVGSALLSDVDGGYRWAVGIIGVITLLVGITVARAPGVSIVTIIFALGLFGLLVGPLEIASGLMLRNAPEEDVA